MDAQAGWEAGFGIVALAAIAALGALAIVLLSATLLLRNRLRAVRDSVAHEAALIDNLSEGIYRCSPEGRLLSANKALVTLNGYASEAAMLAGVEDIAGSWYVQPGRRDEFRRILLADGKVEDFVSEVYRYRTRERIWVSESARLVFDPATGRTLFYEGSVRDVTETVRRLNLEEQMQKLTRELPGALFQFTFHADGTYSVPYLSRGISRLTGFSFGQHLANPAIFQTCIVEADRAAFDCLLAECTAALTPWDHEFRLRTASGEEKWLRISARPERRGIDTSWYGYVTDITSRKVQEMEIGRLAYFDPLTQLPNRRMFLDRMAACVAAFRRGGGFGALLFIDLDNFKSLNDTQGHDVGDAFLSQTARRLSACVTERDLVARIGGDEFVVLLEQSGPERGAATLRGIATANRILAELRKEFIFGKLRHLASASVGVVVFDGTEPRVDELLKRADVAMYEAKAAGRNRAALFDPATLDREKERYRLAADLRLALERGEVVLYFQPQVDHCGEISGAEGLVRWHHPVEGLVMPDRFVALAEQFGVGPDLADYVLERGLRTLSAWQGEPATAHLRLALNVGVNCFAGDDFLPMLRRLLADCPVDATMLTLELTEHVMAKDHARIAARMRDVKALGIRLALDDFGTGYSSLSHLKQLPLDEVKIDGSFVRDIEAAESDRALVKTILAMARTLGLTAVAEHVENVRQQAFLRAFGCDYFQGFLYGPATTEAEFLAFVEAYRAPSRAVAPLVAPGALALPLGLDAPGFGAAAEPQRGAAG